QSDGTAIAWNATGNDTFGTGVGIGSGWNAFTSINFADTNGDGRPDLVGRQSDGTAKVYHATGNDTFDAGATLGTGWNTFTTVTFADLNGDGKPDIVGQLSGGTANVYHNVGPDTFDAGRQFSSGWSAYTWLGFADINRDPLTTPNGANAGYIPPGLPTTVTSPGGARETVSYLANGDIVQTTDAAGLVTRYTYDGLGRIATQTAVSDTYPAGLTTSYTYDKQSRVATQTNPPVTNRVTGAIHTARTTMSYDADSNVTSRVVVDTTGGDASRTISTSYDTTGNVASTTDP